MDMIYAWIEGKQLNKILIGNSVRNIQLEKSML